MFTEDDIQRFVQKCGRKPALIDTCILLLLIIGAYDTKLLNKCKFTNKYTERDYQLLIQILKKYFATPLIITPHILAEFSNQSWQALSGEKFRKYIESIVLRLKQFQEEFVQLHELLKVDICILGQFGFTDVSILDIAKTKNFVIITDDRDLHSKATMDGIPSIKFAAVSASILVKASK